MQAIRVTAHGGPEVLQLADLPTPAPAAGQLLVRVHAAGVNPVDTYIRSGAYSMSKLPYTPGFDAAGVVEAAGPHAEPFQPGDRVYLSDSLTGTYAQYALCHPSSVHPLPARISFAQGAALGIPYATAYRALFQKTQARPGETLLVHGASGGVGTAAVQLARAAGLTVIGTSGTPEGRKLVLDSGAHHVLDHRSPSYRAELLTLTGGRGFDLILEMLANVNLAQDLPLLAKFGRVIVIGSRGPIEINPRDTMSRDASIIGMTLFNTPPEDLARIHAALFASLENGALRPHIGRQFPLAQAPAAHAAVLAPGALGKIILQP